MITKNGASIMNCKITKNGTTYGTYGVVRKNLPGQQASSCPPNCSHAIKKY